MKDEKAFSGKFQKSYKLGTSDSHVNFITANKWSFKEDDVNDIKDIIGTNADEMMIKETRPYDSERLKVVLAEGEENFGSEYIEIAEELLAEKTRESWAKRAASWNSTSLDVLMRVMWEDWTEGEFTIDKSEGCVQIRCTKCPIADAYRSIGHSDLGLIFQCSEDPHIVAGYNSKMKFRRTKTLMAGDEMCDHYYELTD